MDQYLITFIHKGAFKIVKIKSMNCKYWEGGVGYWVWGVLGGERRRGGYWYWQNKRASLVKIRGIFTWSDSYCGAIPY